MADSWRVAKRTVCSLVTLARQQKKRVLILSPFFRNGDRWIDDFCGRPDFEFKKVSSTDPELSWHLRGNATPIQQWLRHFKYAYRGMNWKPDCVVTCFPQLAFAAATVLPLTPARAARLIAWNFNLGSLSSQFKGRIAGGILDRVDRFVVHAREEIANYAQWLRLEQDKFRFVPLQRGRIVDLPPSPVPGPYIVSIGSANRDYGTLLDAVRGTGIRTVVISKKQIIESLPDQANVLKLHSLEQQECDSILNGATLSVVPVSATETASGQVTFLTSMRLGVPTIASRCVSTVDYIRHCETGLLVNPGDAESLRSAIASLWHDESLRSRIGAAGRHYAEENFSDEAAGRHLARLIDEVFAEER